LKKVKLGKSEIEVSIIGLGTWAMGGRWWGGTDESASIRAIHASIDAGVNFIDTAPAYGLGLSEQLIAKAIKGKRDKLVIATKCGLRWNLEKGTFFFDYEPGVPIYRYLGSKSIEQEIENSLRNLNTDYIDLYQSHWQDPTTPISETMETFMKLKEKGKIRAIGVSNASLPEIIEYAKCGILDTDQEKYSILDKEVENSILPWCEKNTVTMLAYSPLSKGLLTGNLSPDRKFKGDDSRISDPRFSFENIKRTNILLDKYLKPVAQKHGASIGNIAVAWLAARKSVVALYGARDEKQVEENIAAGNTSLDKNDMEQVDLFIKECSGN
jgi:aryl-alcohol dehydrogenase-like predicted oxidoreductase